MTQDFLFGHLRDAVHFLYKCIIITTLVCACHFTAIHPYTRLQHVTKKLECCYCYFMQFFFITQAVSIKVWIKTIAMFNCMTSHIFCTHTLFCAWWIFHSYSLILVICFEYAFKLNHLPPKDHFVNLPCNAIMLLCFHGSTIL